MTTFQKVIKYIAVALAAFLTVAVIGGITMAISGIFFLFGEGEAEPAGEMQVYPIDGEISSLSVDLSAAHFKIQTGDVFSVKSNHKYISVESDNGTLRIRETKKPFAVSPKGITVILSVPQDFVFDDAAVAAGAGKVEMDTLSCNTLALSLGAGKADIRNLTANTRARIEGGAGELHIDGGKLRSLELDMGAGRLTLKSRIEGESDIDCGVGKADFILIGSQSDYTIEIDKGIGEAKLSGENMKDDSVYGSGENRLKIDGGIGALSIEFAA